MAMPYANALGMALGNSILPGDQPLPAPAADAMPKMPGKGQMLLGILGDALAGAAGRPGQFAQHLGRLRQQEQEMAQWGLQRRGRLEDYEAQKRIDQRYDKPDIAPALRDAQAWAMMTPEQRTAYQEMRQAGAGDPDVFVTLPNGQVYAGPKSGLAAALTGGAAPVKPVGRLTPIQGGPAPQAPGTFRP